MRLIRSLGVFLLCLATLLPAITRAATAAELQTTRDHAFRAATQLLMFVALEKAGERRAAADKAIASIDATVAGINDANLTTRWQATRTALTASPYENGEINQLRLYAWENEVMAFASDLDHFMPRDLDRNKKDLYELAGRMQVMLVIYLRNSADPLGGANYTGVNSEKELSKLSDEFTAKLHQVMRQNPKHAAALAKVKSKWTFLSARISDFKQRNVPFIADLYGRQIIDMLLGAANAG